MSSIQLIVGLGNPDPQYQATRHNAGAWFVEALAKVHRLSFHEEKRFKSLWAELNSETGKIFLLLPQTYMNLSGDAVSATTHYFKIPSDRILIAHDELDLACGTAKLKFSGNDAGHNGLKDIISKLNTKAFWRLRIGIDRPSPSYPQSASDYVLAKPTVAEKESINQSLTKSLTICDFLWQGELDKAMQTLHRT